MFKDLLDEIKSFKYQITGKVVLRKHKQNDDIELAPFYFNSTTKTVMNFKYDLGKSFQEVLYRMDNWTNKGFGCLIESIDAEYVNTSIYSPLLGRTYIKFPSESKKKTNERFD